MFLWRNNLSLEKDLLIDVHERMKCKWVNENEMENALRGQLSNSPFSKQQSRSLLSLSSLLHLPLSALSSVCLSHLNTPTPSAFLLIFTASSFPCDLLCEGAKLAEGARLPGNRTIYIFSCFSQQKGILWKYQENISSRERKWKVISYSKQRRRFKHNKVPRNRLTL